jgi:hypothetical protein
VLAPEVVQGDGRTRQHRQRVSHLVDLRRVAARPLQGHGGGADPPVADPDPAGGRLADDGPFQTTRVLAVEEGPDAGARPLLVAREQHADRPAHGSRRQRLENGGDRPLGVGRPQPEQPFAALNQQVRGRGVAGVGRDGVDVGVEQQARPFRPEARVDVGVVLDVHLGDRERAQRAQLRSQAHDQRVLLPVGVLGIEGDQLRQPIG